jgi:hypothetical protein
MKNGIKHGEDLFSRVAGQIFCLTNAVLPVVPESRVGIDELGESADRLLPLKVTHDLVEVLHIAVVLLGAGC